MRAVPSPDSSALGFSSAELLLPCGPRRVARRSLGCAQLLLPSRPARCSPSRNIPWEPCTLGVQVEGVGQHNSVEGLVSGLLPSPSAMKRLLDVHRRDVSRREGRSRWRASHSLYFRAQVLVVARAPTVSSRARKMPVPVKGSRTCTPASVSALAELLAGGRGRHSRRMKSTTSVGV